MTNSLEINDLYEAWKTDVARAAKKIARQFAEIDEEDLVQELFLWVFSEKPERTGFAYRMTELKAKDIAWDYRRSYMANSGQYLYRNEDVRKILKQIAFEEDYLTHPLTTGTQPLKSGNTGVDTLDFEDRVVYKIDVLETMTKLSPSYREIILRAYRDKEQMVPDSADERRLSRAVERLTDYLNYKEVRARRERR